MRDPADPLLVLPDGPTGPARPAAFGPRPRAEAGDLAGWHARNADALILDARDPGPFALGHLPGAGRFTPAEFRERRAELPPRTADVWVVHDAVEAAREAAEQLAFLGYAHVRWLDVPLDALTDGHADSAAAARLWRPSPFLERVLPLLPAGRALDFACGTARESVYLALHGWRAEGWDHDPDALARAGALAARHGVAITTKVVELEAPLPVPEPAWDVIVVCRFLHRPLFPWLEASLAPGGALVYETFRTGQERYGRPLNPRYLLQPGELSSAFPSLRVEHYEESEPEGGPVMARLLARRA